MKKARLAGAALMLVAMLWAWVMVPAGLIVPIRIWPGGPDLPVPVFLMPLVGLLAGWAGLRLLKGLVLPPPPPDEDEAPPIPDGLFAILCIAVATLALLVLIAADGNAIAVPQAALLLVSGTLALLAAGYAMTALREGASVELSSHWGGLGGAVGGWRIPPVTTLLLLALIFLGTTVAIGGSGGGERDKGAGKAADKATADNVTAIARPAPAGGGASRPAIGQDRATTTAPAVNETNTAGAQARPARAGADAASARRGMDRPRPGRQLAAPGGARLRPLARARAAAGDSTAMSSRRLPAALS